MKKRLAVLFIALAFLLCVVPFAQAENEAVEYSRQCTISPRDVREDSHRLFDADLQTRVYLNAAEELTLSWSEDTPIRQVLLQWYRLPSSFRISFLNKELTVVETRNGVTEFFDFCIDVPQDVFGVSITSTEQLNISTLRTFGEGELPVTVFDWNPLQQSVDYMLVAAHQGDETLCFGSVIPTLSGIHKASGVTLFLTEKDRARIAESINSVWTLGQRTHPLFGEFRPLEGRKGIAKVEGYWDEDEAILLLVRQLRRYKPAVVISHSVEGEEDGQHALVSRLVQEALPLAANAQFDPESVEQYGQWAVSKLYLHLYEQNALVLDAAAVIDGVAISEIVTAADSCYVLDGRDATVVPNMTQDGGMFNYGLAYSTVGDDTGANDMFENLSVGEPSPSIDEGKTSEPSIVYSEDFASPIPVAEPTAQSSFEIDDEQEESEKDNAPISEVERDTSEENRKKALIIVIAGAVLTVLLFVFTFRWFRYSKGTFLALLICLLPLIFMTVAYLLIVKFAI